MLSKQPSCVPQSTDSVCLSSSEQAQEATNQPSSINQIFDSLKLLMATSFTTKQLEFSVNSHIERIAAPEPNPNMVLDEGAQPQFSAASLMRGTASAAALLGLLTSTSCQRVTSPSVEPDAVITSARTMPDAAHGGGELCVNFNKEKYSTLRAVIVDRSKLIVIPLVSNGCHPITQLSEGKYDLLIFWKDSDHLILRDSLIIEKVDCQSDL